MYHLVYLTTNLINNKIYVGVHSTYNLNDGYLGSGKAIKHAIKKYGKHNFKRTILHYCLTKEEIYKWEKHIVDDTFINNKNTYNSCIGGKGGLTYIRTNIHKSIIRVYALNRTPEQKAKFTNKHE